MESNGPTPLQLHEEKKLPKVSWFFVELLVTISRPGWNKLFYSVWFLKFLKWIQNIRGLLRKKTKIDIISQFVHPVGGDGVG